jgi:hypothetical protein
MVTMRKFSKWRSDAATDAYLKGLAGRDFNKNIVIDYAMKESLEAQGFNSEILPASIVRLDQVWEAFDGYDASKSVKVDMFDPHISEGFNLAMRLYGIPRNSQKLSALDINQVVTEMKLNKSAGLTEMGKKKKEVLEYGMTRATQILAERKKDIKGVQYAKRPRPCLVGIRTQQKPQIIEDRSLDNIKENYRGKTRLVWMYPFEVTIVEGMFALPIMDRFKHTKTPITIGVHKGVLGSRIHHEIGSRRYKYALDYSRFDSTISADLIHAAFRILRTNFGHFTPYQDRAWNVAINYFVHTPIVMPDGYLYVGKEHGVPSGSFFTQIIDSIVNTILVGAMSHKFSLMVDESKFMVLGDDLLMSSDVKLNLPEISAFLLEYGIIMHPEKCETRMHYLGAYWKNGVPTRPLNEVVNKMICPEHYRTYPKDSIARDRYILQVKLAYLSCYWNLTPLVFKGTLNPNTINDFTIKNHVLQIVDDDEEFCIPYEFLPGYYKFHYDYLEDPGQFETQDFAAIQYS